MSFNVQDVNSNSAVNQVAYNNVPSIFPGFATVSVSLTNPFTSYTNPMPITVIGSTTNFTVDSTNIYSTIACNFSLTWQLTITVPSASKNSPVYLNPYVNYRYDNGTEYENFSYNLISVNSPTAQTFNLTNVFQNTWEDVYIYFYIYDPLYINPSFVVSASNITITAMQSTSSDGGQYYT